MDVPTQSFPVSPPPITITFFPLAEIYFLSFNPCPCGKMLDYDLSGIEKLLKMNII